MWVNSKSVTSRAARALMLASAAALVLTSVSAQAAPATARQADGRQAAAVGETEIGARKRHRRGNAAGLAMMGLMVGTVGAVIAAQQRREAYERAYAAPRYYHGGGYPHGYGYSQSYVQHRPHVHVQPQPYVHPHAYARRNPAAINSFNHPPYSDPALNQLNQQSGAINYGPPRIGW
jgi:hypothetical protein